MTAPAVLGIKDAATYSGTSESTIRRALACTDPAAFPPPLRGKRKGASTNANAPIVIPVAELDRWISEWPDA
jgi:hypothetical protein